MDGEVFSNHKDGEICAKLQDCGVILDGEIIQNPNDGE